MSGWQNRDVVGLDLSLTQTGIATAEGTTVFCPIRKGVGRLIEIRDRLVPGLAAVRLVVLEGYSFGSRMSHAHALGELGGVIRVALVLEGAKWLAVPPATLKRFACGKGNAPKDAVLAAAVRAGSDADSNDEADAWWLRQIGLMLLRDDRLAVRPTAERRAVIAALDEPDPDAVRAGRV